MWKCYRCGKEPEDSIKTCQDCGAGRSIEGGIENKINVEWKFKC